MKGESSDEEEDTKVMENFFENFKKTTVLFSRSKPKDIFNFIKSKLSDSITQIKESDAIWTMAFTLEEPVELQDRQQFTEDSQEEE